MAARLNVVLVIVDSLRAASLGPLARPRCRTPFMDRLGRETVAFARAYATECWTLPTHLSMFTGLLPSEHGAHFQTMAYHEPAPTLAEIYAGAGYHTEIITRNSLLDGTIPGATRGFQVNTRPLAELRGASGAMALLLALAKPRVRRLVQGSGFFHALQKSRRDFVQELARMGIPADRRVLGRALERMGACRKRGQPYFLVLNLYDVHAPYSPTETSPLRSFRSLAGWGENLSLPLVLPRICGHGYLRPGFRLSARHRQMLRGRYARAVELMDDKLGEFWDGTSSAGLLRDTLVIVTSDHGEAFGEHGLYLHDASVYDTHLHVPLWIHHPACPPRKVNDVVSTRELFGLLRAVAAGEGVRGTLLDAAACVARPLALAEHYHDPHTAGLIERYTHNVAAAIVGSRKLVVRAGGLERYDLDRDPEEISPEGGSLADFERVCRREGWPAAAVDEALRHARRWTSDVAARWHSPMAVTSSTRRPSVASDLGG
jgi:hypothetical protein